MIKNYNERDFPITPSWAVVSLRVSSECISASEIAARLGIDSSKIYEKGTVDVNGPTERKPRSESLYVLEIGDRQTDSLESRLANVADLLHSNDELFRSLGSSCHIDLFCGVASDSGQASVIFPATLLQCMSQLSMDLVLDLYPPASLNSL